MLQFLLWLLSLKKNDIGVVRGSIESYSTADMFDRLLVVSSFSRGRPSRRA